MTPTIRNSGNDEGFRDGKKISGWQGFKGRESKMSRQSTEDIRTENLFCMTVYTSLHVCQKLQNTRYEERTLI